MISLQHRGALAVVTLAAASAALLSAPGTASAQDGQLQVNPQTQGTPEIQSGDLNIDFRQQALNRAQRPVEITVPYTFSNLPNSAQGVRIECGVDFTVTRPGSAESTDGIEMMSQDISLSGGAANGTLTLSGSIPDDETLETWSVDEINQISNVQASQYRCSVFFDFPGTGWAWAQNVCVQGGCNGQYNLTARGQF